MDPLVQVTTISRDSSCAPAPTRVLAKDGTHMLLGQQLHSTPQNLLFKAGQPSTSSRRATHGRCHTPLAFPLMNATQRAEACGPSTASPPSVSFRPEQHRSGSVSSHPHPQKHNNKTKNPRSHPAVLPQSQTGTTARGGHPRSRPPSLRHRNAPSHTQPPALDTSRCTALRIRGSGRG